MVDRQPHVEYLRPPGAAESLLEPARGVVRGEGGEVSGEGGE